MKEIETSKGRFIVTDINGEVRIYNAQWFKKLSEITEEEASSIVDSDDDYGVTMYQNYRTTSMQYFDEQITAIQSLHSLIKSQGIEITNNTYIFKV